jgi:predicted RNase H-like nuclease (RuvC/YqgF family)
MTETDTATLTEPQIEAPVENDPQTPEDLEEQIASLRREIQMLREHDETVRERAEDCTRLTLEWEQSKKVTLSKKRALNEALDELRQLARGRPTYGELFDQAGKSNGQVEPADALDAGDRGCHSPVLGPAPRALRAGPGRRRRRCRGSR